MGTSTSEDSSDTVDVLLACARAAAMASARMLSAVVAVAEQSRAGFDADEVAYAMAWTQGHARHQVDFGRYLIGTLPDVFAACISGDLDAARAHVFFDVLAVADDAVAQRVAERVLPVASGLTTTQVRDRLRRALLREDPDGAAKRTRRTVDDRYVAAVPDGEGTASLTVSASPPHEPQPRSSEWTRWPGRSSSEAMTVRFRNCAPTHSWT